MLEDVNEENKELQDDMLCSWSFVRDYQTDKLGVNDGRFYTWTNNGGKKGSHDRMRGDGRWVETYEKPRKVKVPEAIEWLMNALGLDLDEAIEEIAEHSEIASYELVKECKYILTGTDGAEYYDVVGTIYKVENVYDFCVVDEDEIEELQLRESE